MSWSRILAYLGIAFFVGFTLVHAFMPWVWQGPLEVSRGLPAQNITYHCAAPFGPAYARPTIVTSFKVVGTPCSERHIYQYMAIFDAVFGVAAAVVATEFFRRRAAAEFATRT